MSTWGRILSAAAFVLAWLPAWAQQPATACEQDPTLNSRFDCACMAAKRAELLAANPSMNPAIAEMTSTWHCPNLPRLHAHWLQACRQGSPSPPEGYNEAAFCTCYADHRLAEQRKAIGKRPDSGAEGVMTGLANTTCTVSLRGKTTPEPAWGPTLLGTWRLAVEGSVEMRLIIDREDVMRVEKRQRVRHFTGRWQFADGREAGNASVRIWVTPEPPTLSMRVRHWGCEGPYHEQSPLKGTCGVLPYSLVREPR